MTLSAALHGGVLGPRWTPRELSGLVAWFDASVTTSVTTGTGGVSQWDDLSGNGNHATRSTTTSRPDSVTDGIDFVAANSDTLNTSVSASAISRCVAAVIKPDVTTGVTAIVGTVTNVNGGWFFGIYNGKLDVQAAYVADIGNGTATVSTSADSVVLANTTASAWRLSVNGTADSGSHTRTLTAGLSMAIGTSNARRNDYDGTMREIVVAGSLSTADQERLEGYLAWKWSLVGSLPAGHPYKNIRP